MEKACSNWKFSGNNILHWKRHHYILYNDTKSFRSKGRLRGPSLLQFPIADNGRLGPACQSYQPDCCVKIMIIIIELLITIINFNLLIKCNTNYWMSMWRSRLPYPKFDYDIFQLRKILAYTPLKYIEIVKVTVSKLKIMT